MGVNGRATTIVRSISLSVSFYTLLIKTSISEDLVVYYMSGGDTCRDEECTSFWDSSSSVD
jgi:hypothetical protein